MILKILASILIALAFGFFLYWLQKSTSKTLQPGNVWVRREGVDSVRILSRRGRWIDFEVVESGVKFTLGLSAFLEEFYWVEKVNHVSKS